MNSQPVSPATALLQRFARRNMPVRLGAFALAVVFTASQVPAQPLMSRDATVQTQTTSSQTTTANTAVPAAPAPVTLSAPIPNIEPASQSQPAADSLFALAQDVAQSSSSQSLTDPIEPASKPAATKTKAPHHGLGIAMAVSGIAVLGASAFFFGLQNHFCSGSDNSTCNSVRTGSIIGMAGGGALAATGFYFQFHK